MCGPSMQISGNRMEPSLVSKPHAEVIHIQVAQRFLWPVFYGAAERYHRAKPAWVGWRHIPGDWPLLFGLIRSVVGSDQN